MNERQERSRRPGGRGRTQGPGWVARQSVRWATRRSVTAPARDLPARRVVDPGMKKRSMLAIASLATGFVVAAITPSHGQDAGDLGNLNVGDTLTSLDHTIASESFALDDDAPGRTD